MLNMVHSEYGMLLLNSIEDIAYEWTFLSDRKSPVVFWFGSTNKRNGRNVPKWRYEFAKCNEMEIMKCCKMQLFFFFFFFFVFCFAMVISR